MSAILFKHEMESAELKQHITRLIDEKAKEFATLMKVQMNRLVDNKVSSEYQEDSPFEEIYLCLQQSQFHPIYHLTFYRRSYTFICETSSGKSLPQTIEHNLSPAMLHIIRIASDNGCPYSRVMRLIDSQKHMTNCIEFESTCRQEYDVIETKKLELYELLKDQHQKKDYYAKLEERIKKVETKEKDIELEKKKLAEERAYLLEVKRKLLLMKEEVEKEKAQIKSVNLDDFH